MNEWHPGPAWLFCPASRPDRYHKALDAADVVILDLEDAVAPRDKADARVQVQLLADAGALQVDRTVLRLNATGTIDHAADVRLAAKAGVRVVMLPKSEHREDIAALDHDVIALAETPLGVESAHSIAHLDNVVGMMWGADDLVAGMGGVSSRHPDGTYRDTARYARQRVLLAAKAHGLLALDGVHMDIADLKGLASECEDAVAVGFDASVAIHPSQVPVIKASYAPTTEALAWAQRLLTHVGDSRGVTTFEGRMVDGPIYKQAERLMRLAASAKTTGVGDG